MNQAAEQPEPVPARPAATVLLVRDAEPTGVEVFVLLSGVYLLYYFWVVDVNGDSGPLNEAVENLQDRIAIWLNDNWQVVAVILAVVVVTAVAYVSVRRRPGGDRSVGSPLREPTS